MRFIGSTMEIAHCWPPSPCTPASVGNRSFLLNIYAPSEVDKLISLGTLEIDNCLASWDSEPNRRSNLIEICRKLQPDTDTGSEPGIKSLTDYRLIWLWMKRRAALMVARWRRHRSDSPWQLTGAALSHSAQLCAVLGSKSWMRLWWINKWNLRSEERNQEMMELEKRV